MEERKLMLGSPAIPRDGKAMSDVHKWFAKSVPEEAWVIDRLSCSGRLVVDRARFELAYACAGRFTVCCL
jgi:hypothetical protein